MGTLRSMNAISSTARNCGEPHRMCNNESNTGNVRIVSLQKNLLIPSQAMTHPVRMSKESVGRGSSPLGIVAALRPLDCIATDGEGTSLCKTSV